MNISYTIPDGSPEDLALARLKKTHNRANGTSLTTRQYAETVEIPAMLARAVAIAAQAAAERRDILDAVRSATPQQIAQVEAIFGL